MNFKVILEQFLKHFELKWLFFFNVSVVHHGLGFIFFYWF